MYVRVGSKDYTEISRLSFDPETDVTGSSVPINEFQVDIRTDDEISMGGRVSLYDDMDNLWAKYWIVYAERPDKYTVEVRAQSALRLLDKVSMDAVMYESTPVSTVLSSVLAPLNNEYTIDSSLSSATVSGYCPRQTARLRLQWVCMAIGAYLKNYFNDVLEIASIDDENEIVIPAEKTYWKPKVTYRDYVTAVRVYYYSYDLRTPSRTEDYVTIGDKSKGEQETYYVQNVTQITLTNSDAPAAATENVVELEGMTLINQSNASSIASHLAKYYFKRMEVDLDVIDNGEYYPGQRVVACTDEDTMAVGYINSCSFAFGLQAKASVHMTPCEDKDSALLVITYTWGDYQIGIRTYRFPIGYGYEVDNPYIQMNLTGHWYLFRPTAATVSGTMAAGTNNVTQQEELALDLYKGDLHVISVDSATLVQGGVNSVVIG